MIGKVLCFASAKGGAGKTVITATIGTFLNALGKRVLLVDADAATNGLTLLYIKEVLSRQRNASDETPVPEGLFEGNSETEATGFPLRSGMDIIPATYHFLNTEAYQQKDFASRLARTLERRKGDYDYILLDAQAGSDFCASVAMRKSISDFVVLVSEYDPMSAAGIERLKGLLHDDLTYTRTWILLNKILPEFAKNFGDFLEVARYLSPIPWDADVVRAYARRRLALDTENGNAFTIAVMQAVRGLLDIKAWIENRAEAIRQPIEVQYSDFEHELGAILEESARAEAHQSRIEWLSWLVTLGVVLPLATVFLFFARYKGFLSGASVFEEATLAVFLIVLLRATLKLWFDARIPKTAVKLDLAKLNRRREVIEERLKKLEILRAADPESLLRHRGGT